MKYAVEMGSGTIICIPRFYKDRFRHSKVDEGGGGYTTHTDSTVIS
jgi:hypothetical protein